MTERNPRSEVVRELTKLRGQFIAGCLFTQDELKRITPMVEMDLPMWRDYEGTLIEFNEEMERDRYLYFNPPEARQEMRE